LHPRNTCNTRKWQKIVRDISHRFMLGERIESQRDKEKRVNHTLAKSFTATVPIRSTIGDVHSPTSGVWQKTDRQELETLRTLFALSRELRRARDRDLRALCRDRAIDRSERESIAERITDPCEYERGKRIIATRYPFHVISSGFIVALCYRTILIIPRLRTIVNDL